MKPKAPHNAARIRDRYRGETALQYEAKRVGAGKWRAEHEAMRVFLSSLPKQSVVVDIPIGTGRYAELYADYDMIVRGLDTSPDMLKLAGQQLRAHGVTANLDIHDALKLLPSTYDVAVCTRLYNHFTLKEAQRAFGNLLTACPTVIFSLRQPKVPVTRNWHKTSDLLAPFMDRVADLETLVLEENAESVYTMEKVTRVA